MINCPKCAAPSPDAAVECTHCGIVFAKFAQRVAADGPDVVPLIAETPRQIVRDPRRGVAWVARAALLLGLIVWTWQFARVPMGVAVKDTVLHLPNLVFHEAGHVLFALFGRFMTVLGGSLFQFGLPLALAGVFLRQRDQFGAAV